MEQTQDSQGHESARARQIVVFVIALVIFVSGTWWWWNGRPERHLDQATRHLQEGRPASARQWLTLPEQTPRTADQARLLRAQIALELDSPSAAVTPLEQIAPDGPLAAEAAYWKGKVLLAQGNLPFALAWFARSLQERPDHPECLRAMAVAAYDLGDLETVLRALRDLTRVQPDDHAAWRTLGLVRLQMPDAGDRIMEEAADAYRTSLELYPHQPLARLELADVLMRQGHLHEARDQLNACRGRVPEAQHLSLLARISWELGDREQTIALLDEAQDQGLEHPDLFALRGLIAQAEGRPEDAEPWFDRAIDADLFNFRRYYQRATLLRILGRSEQANADAQRAEELKQALETMSAMNAEAAARPTDPAIRNQLGRLCERLGKVQLAASWYRAALACDPGNQEAAAALAALGP
ncbi:tetratricopeptide repeat protein [Tautonia marina]|uniref:tetratricopeptide repeat protein n=1 Tax=Tautonia marina TaxID=2653855 RepID=UPI001375AC09|nr:tetratricopeptide repeat protein [Tautonia marina]